MEGPNQVRAVEVISDLLTLVSEHGVRSKGESAFHEVRQEAMELGAGMPRTGQASSPETSGAHSEVTPILLHEYVGCHFRGTKEAVQRTVDRHFFRNTPEIGRAHV